MIGFVKGVVFNFGPSWVLIDVNGIGYRINFYHSDCLKIGEEILIYTYQNVKEDEISLYGFLSLQEYDLFIRLISVKGLGPKGASTILAKATTDQLIKAIEDKNIDFILSMPGVGKKTASQIILDLKGKLVTKSEEYMMEDRFKDVKDTLLALGYKNSEIKPVLTKLANSQGDQQALLKQALSLLAK